MILAVRTVFLTLIAPALIMLLWARLAPISYVRGPAMDFFVLWGGPLIALATGLVGIVTAHWRSLTKMAVASAYIALAIPILPYAMYGSFCVVRTCPFI